MGLTRTLLGFGRRPKGGERERRGRRREKEGESEKEKGIEARAKT